MSQLRLAASSETVSTHAAPRGAVGLNISCSRTLLRLRASSLLAARAAEQPADPRHTAPLVLSLEVNNQTSPDAPPAVTPACVKTIVALASMRRRQGNQNLFSLPSAACASSRGGSWQSCVNNGCQENPAPTTKLPSPSHETVVHGPTVIRHAHRRSRPGFRSAYRLPRLPNAPIDVENPFFVQLEVTNSPITHRTHWSPNPALGGRVSSRFRIHNCPRGSGD